MTVDPRAYDAQRQFVETDSGLVSYVDVGVGRGALFIHGVGRSGYLWRNVVAALEGERRCITVDLPLHGRTPARADQDYSLTRLAKVVECFCAALDLGGVDLVANDTGGAIAQIVAANQPQRFATLTLTNCETLGNVPPWAFKPTVWLARIGLLAPLRPRRLANVRRLRKLFFGVGYQNVEALSEDAVRAYLEPLVGTPQTAREFQRWLASLHNRDLIAVEDKLRRLAVAPYAAGGILAGSRRAVSPRSSRGVAAFPRPIREYIACSHEPATRPQPNTASGSYFSFTRRTRSRLLPQ